MARTTASRIWLNLSLLSVLAVTIGTPAACFGQTEAMVNGAGARKQASAPVSIQTIRQWFSSYDAIRRDAQMNPAERQKADAMMSQGLSMVVPGEEKVESQKLLNSLVLRYKKAAQQLENLTYLSVTSQLHRGYHQYFADAASLFSDYIKVQNNLLAKDEHTGQPLAATLMGRKEELSSLDENNKELDTQLRAQLNIPSYRY